MTLRGQSYKEIRAVFMQTHFGKVTLELAVGQQRVVVKTPMGIQHTCNREELAKSDNPLLRSCKVTDPERFKEFIGKLGALDA